MQLTAAQLTTLKASILANTNVIASGPFAGTQVKNVPNNADGRIAVAAWYNLAASPAFWVWKTALSRREVYHTVSLDNTVWKVGAYKSQTQGEQGAWTQMFMGDEAPANMLNFRDGVFDIFSGSAPQNAQRAHIFAVSRRQATSLEKLFAVAVTSVGGITVSANNGNVLGDTLGGTTNPAVMVVEGELSADDVQNALNS